MHKRASQHFQQKSGILCLLNIPVCSVITAVTGNCKFDTLVRMQVLFAINLLICQSMFSDGRLACKALDMS